MKTFRLFLLAATIFGAVAPGYSQNTMYFMDRLPQTLSMNPASVPEVNFFFAFPGLGHISAEAYNSGFNLGQFLDYREKLGRELYDPQTFLDMMGGLDHTMVDARATLFSFGFKLRHKGYFSFSWDERNFIEMQAPPEFVYLLDDFDKIREKMPLDIRGIDILTLAWSQLAVTWSRTFGDKLTLGISPKLTGGLAAISSENLHMEVEEVEDYDYEITYGGDILLGLPVPVNPAAISDEGELDGDEDIISEDALKDLRPGDLFRNPGFALDAGARFDLNGKWSFSASLLDAGTFRWKNYGYKLTPVDEALKVQEDQTFKLRIPSRLIVAANYRLSPNWNTGMMLKNTFFSGNRTTSATVSVNGHIGRMLSTSVSYTANYDYDNLGLGIRLRFFPGFDLFAVTDNILDVFDYRATHHATLAVGFNFSVGLKEKKSVEQEEILEPDEPAPY